MTFPNKQNYFPVLLSFKISIKISMWFVPEKAAFIFRWTLFVIFLQRQAKNFKEGEETHPRRVDRRERGQVRFRCQWVGPTHICSFIVQRSTKTTIVLAPVNFLMLDLQRQAMIPALRRQIACWFFPFLPSTHLSTYLPIYYIFVVVCVCPSLHF